MVTKELQARLRAGRIKKNARMDYTIKGPTHTQVVSNLEAECERQILRGDRALQSAQEDIEREYALTSQKGLARAGFNYSSGDQTMENKQPPHTDKTDTQTERERATSLKDQAMADALHDMRRERALSEEPAPSHALTPKL